MTFELHQDNVKMTSVTNACLKGHLFQKSVNADAVNCYRRSSVVGMCVCVCVLVTSVSPAENGWTIDMPIGRLTRVCQRNNVLDGDADPQGKEQFFAVAPGPLNSIVSHCCAVCCKNVITAPLLKRTAMLPTWLMSYYIVPREKSASCDAAFRQHSLLYLFSCITALCYKINYTNETSMSVLVILWRKSTLAESRADPLRVTLSMRRALSMQKRLESK